MKKEIGLWIDHREAIIVILTDGGEEIKHIASNNGRGRKPDPNDSLSRPQ